MTTHIPALTTKQSTRQLKSPFEAGLALAYPKLSDLALSLTGNEESAADLVQQTMLEGLVAWQAGGSSVRQSDVQDHENLYRSLQIRLYDIFEAENVQREEHPHTELIVDGDDHSEVPGVLQFQAPQPGLLEAIAVCKEIGRLPLRQRHMVWEASRGATLTDMAGELGVSTSTVRSGLEGARRTLRRAVGRPAPSRGAVDPAI